MCVCVSMCVYFRQFICETSQQGTQEWHHLSKNPHFYNPKTRQLIPKVLPAKRREWSHLSLHVGMLGHGYKMNSLRKCKLSVHFTCCRDSTSVFPLLCMVKKHSICFSEYKMRKTISWQGWHLKDNIWNVLYFTCHIIACPIHIKTTLIRGV